MKNIADKQFIETILNKENEILSIYANDTDELSKTIYTIRKSGIELLQNFCNWQIQNTQNIQNNKLDIDAKLALEKELCIFYDNITSQIMDDKLKDICFRLWATSENEYQLALENELEKNKNTTLNQINVFLKDAQDIASGKANAKKIQETINNPNFSFFAGLAAGGLLAMSIKEIIKENNN